MHNKLLILGAGQYGLLVKDIAQAMGSFVKIDFLDDNNPVAVGQLSALEKFRETYDMAVVAIGNPGVRGDLLRQLETFGYAVPVVKHPSAVVMPSAKLGKGCIVEAMAVVNSNAQIGEGCLICAGAVVNHNAKLGSCCQIDCNAVVSARVCVPDGTKVPCGAVFN